MGRKIVRARRGDVGGRLASRDALARSLREADLDALPAAGAQRLYARPCAIEMVRAEEICAKGSSNPAANRPSRQLVSMITCGS